MHTYELSEQLTSYRLPVRETVIGAQKQSIINKYRNTRRFYFSATQTQNGVGPKKLYVVSLQSQFLCMKIELSYKNRWAFPGFCDGLGQLMDMKLDCDGLYHKVLYGLNPIDDINVYKG